MYCCPDFREQTSVRFKSTQMSFIQENIVGNVVFQIPAVVHLLCLNIFYQQSENSRLTLPTPLAFAFYIGCNTFDLNCFVPLRSMAQRKYILFCLEDTFISLWHNTHSLYPSTAENFYSLANIRKLLTHFGIVTPYGDSDLGQHWLR